MRCIFMMAIFWLVAISGVRPSSDKPLLGKTPPTAEAKEVYGAFLDSYVGDSGQPTNLSDKTFPLNLRPKLFEGPRTKRVGASERDNTFAWNGHFQRASGQT